MKKDYVSQFGRKCGGAVLLLGLVLTINPSFARDENSETKILYRPFTTSIMAPLLIGEFNNLKLDGPGWDTERELLRRLRAEEGHKGYSLDLWWGLLMRNGWNAPADPLAKAYYRKQMRMAIDQGYRLKVILSHHACGGGVGDGKTNIPLPPGAWEEATRMSGGLDPHFVNELGQQNLEVIGRFVDPRPLLMPFWREAFSLLEEFAPYIDEIVPGVGPAGEFTDPAYHSPYFSNDPDRNWGVAGEWYQFPGRGSLQVGSDLAKMNLRDHLIKKYGNGDPDLAFRKLKAQWNTNFFGDDFHDWRQIDFFTSHEKMARFWQEHQQFSPMGQDFFDWLHGGLKLHGHRIFDGVLQVFAQPGSPFEQAGYFVKVNGVYWKFDDRTALLTAGHLVTRGARWDGRGGFEWPSSWNSPTLGYDETLGQFFRELKAKYPRKRIGAVWTAGEAGNGRDFNDGWREGNPPDHISDADRLLGGSSLTRAFTLSMASLGVEVDMENALADRLRLRGDVVRMVEQSKPVNVISDTYLRGADAIDNPVLSDNLRQLRDFKERQFHSCLALLSLASGRAPKN